MKNIIVKGAQEHNLQNINITIPRDQLVVITGVSGSGKSSLAFDTIYAEGQRRYVESLSAYARQFLEMMQKPKVETIEGLSPAISIEQKTTSRNPRSTVATVTEIYDYMRLLWARVGVPYSPTTGKPIIAQSASEIIQKIQDFPEGTKLYILSPLVRGRKGEYKKELTELRKRGFQRVIIDGQTLELDDIPVLDKKIKHTIEIIIDRLIIKPDLGQRLASSVESALEMSDGLLYIQIMDDNDEENIQKILFSSKFCCPESGFTIEEIEPRLFSFNSPFGACQSCDGLGHKTYFDPQLIVPFPDKPIGQGAIDPWNTQNKDDYNRVLYSLLRHFNIDIKTPFKDIPIDVQNVILFGSDENINVAFKSKTKTYKLNQPFDGVIPFLQRREKYASDFWMKEYIKKYQAQKPCEACQGYRLKSEALAVKIENKNIGEITLLSILSAKEWFDKLQSKLSINHQKIAAPILKEIGERLNFLNQVGLDYLTLARSSATLSGGESQRIRLASQIGSGLTGVLYVLDEPSIGLHQKDNAQLLETLKRLRDIGNSVLVVEHDEDAIRTADHIIDIGPYAGVHGGHVVAQGTLQDIISSPKSLTGQYLSGAASIQMPTTYRKGNGKNLKIIGASANNLKDIDVKFPLGCLVCITGVSGSGKSSLIIDILYKAAAKYFYNAHEVAGAHKKIQGLENLDKIIDIDQSPIGRTPRSNPATYTGAFGPIRDWFAGLPEAASRGYKSGRFSFNVKGGRCETCQGDGHIKVEMHFLPDVYVKCEACKGKRYNKETLEVVFKGKSIADVLNMTIDDATEFFKNMPSIFNKLDTLHQVGLGYMTVGQSATTLSGGEAQRIKLAKELSKRSTGKTLYILDEPTTGLHFDDVNRLLGILHKLVDQGNSIFVIEHNLEVVKTSDWVVDLGPDGGNKGGDVMFSGTPQNLSKCQQSYTGEYLKPYFKKKAA